MEKNDLSAHHLYSLDNSALFRGGVTVCVDSAGSVVWEHTTPGCSPVTIAGEYAWYFDASESGGLHRITLSSGRRDRHYKVENSCSGAMVFGEIVVMCTNDGVLRAFKNKSTPGKQFTTEK